MPKWLPRTLLIILALLVITGGLVGAYYLGQKSAGEVTYPAGSPEFSPRLDRDRVKPSLRDDTLPVLPWFHSTDRGFPITRYPMLGLFFAILWLIARLALLILLIWLIVRWVVRRTPPAPAPHPARNDLPDTAASEDNPSI